MRPMNHDDPLIHLRFYRLYRLSGIPRKRARALSEARYRERYGYQPVAMPPVRDDDPDLG